MTTNAEQPTESDQDRSFTAATGGASNLFYFSLPAPDLERSKAFYSRLFGWRVEGGSLGGHVANVTPPGGLYPGGAPDDAGVWFTVDNIDEAIDRLVELGGRVEGEVQRSDIGASVTCVDDQGTRFSLQDPTGGIHADHARNPRPGSEPGDLFYFSLQLADGDRARRFYRGLLGWELSDPAPQGGMNANNLVIDGGVAVRAPSDGGTVPPVELWFRVADIASSLDLVRELKGEAGEVTDTPQGLVAYCRDDQGVAFGVVEPAPGY